MFISQTSQVPGHGDASLTGAPVSLDQHISDQFYDPIVIDHMRRALRAWFCAYLPYAEGLDTGWSSFNLEGNAHVYQLLDELLAGLMQQTFKPVEA